MENIPTAQNAKRAMAGNHKSAHIVTTCVVGTLLHQTGIAGVIALDHRLRQRSGYQRLTALVNGQRTVQGHLPQGPYVE